MHLTICLVLNFKIEMKCRILPPPISAFANTVDSAPVAMKNHDINAKYVGFYMRKKVD